LSLLLPAGAHAQDVLKWTVNGASREAIVVRPAKQYPGGKAPLVFAFHGHGDTMQGFARGIRLETYWPEAIIVYPQGLPTNPATDPQGWGWIYSAFQDGQRDVKFVDAMGSFIFVCIKAAPVFINEYQFQDTMQTMARFASVNRQSPEDIRAALLKEAAKNDIPLRAEDIRVTNNNGNVRIEAAYSVTVDLRVYQWTLNFHPTASNNALV